MRIVVFSDTHGSFMAADTIVKSNPLCDHFIFLGDGMEEIEHIMNIYPEKRFHCVAGNCDSCDTPSSLTIELFNTKIFMTHGHHYNVRESHEALVARAREDSAQVILYGHTHCRYYKYSKGFHILNPGSAFQPKDGLPPGYAIIDLTPCGINFMHIDV